MTYGIEYIILKIQGGTIESREEWGYPSEQDADKALNSVKQHIYERLPSFTTPLEKISLDALHCAIFAVVLVKNDSGEIRRKISGSPLPLWDDEFIPTQNLLVNPELEASSLLSSQPECEVFMAANPWFLRYLFSDETLNFTDTDSPEYKTEQDAERDAQKMKQKAGEARQEGKLFMKTPLGREFPIALLRDIKAWEKRPYATPIRKPMCHLQNYLIAFFEDYLITLRSHALPQNSML